MNKCRLCQQIYHNLIIIHNIRLKSLIHTILKFKGFKDSWVRKDIFSLCEKCIKSVENLAIFWENIPEANKKAAGIQVKLKDQTETAPYRNEQILPALTLEAEENSNCKAFTKQEEKREPIKLHIKLTPKRKKQEKSKTKNISINWEPLEKRTRRCPQRYKEFQLTINTNASVFGEGIPSLKTDSNVCNKVSFNELPQVALIRLENSQIIGTLAETFGTGMTSKIRISCQICCQIFRSEKVFQEHLKTHSPTDFQQSEYNLDNYLYYCKLCDKPFTNRRTVMQHFKLVHSKDRRHKCLYCAASFKYKNNLDYHMSTKHDPKKCFECTFCKKTFVLRYELKIHIRTHTKEKPYKCELCSYASAHKSNLKTHQKVKHFEGTKKSTFSTRQFIPPAELVEPEEQLLDETDINTDHSLVLKDTVVYEEASAETLFQRDSNHFEQSNISNEEIKSFEELMGQNTLPCQDLEDRNISGSTNFESFIENLEQNDEATATKVMFGTEGYINTNHEFETEFPNSEDNKTLKAMSTNENFEGFFKAQPIKGVIQLDSNLLKVLPSTSLLGLKKWPKSFQSTTENQLQLVKSSSVIHNKSLNKFEADKVINDENRKTPDSTNSFNGCKPLQQIEYLKLISSQLEDENISNQAAQKFSISNDKLINISELEQNNLRDINKHKTYEITSNKSHEETPLEINVSRPGKALKVSSSHIKIKSINQPKKTTNENNSSLTILDGNKKSITNEILENQPIKIVTTSSNENLNANKLITNINLKKAKMLSTPTSQSLLKPIVNILPTTSLAINQTLLHNKPLITKIDILPSLKLTTTLQNQLPTITNLLKPPNDYKHQCPYCYKYFKQKSPLTKHLRTHTGEKPYKCNLCPKSFADPSNFKKHKFLHKSIAETLNINRITTTAYAAQSSPAYSTVSDPDPDGIEVMQTLKKFDCSSTEDDDDVIDDNDSDFSNMESQMWHDALDEALYSEEIRENIRTNLMGFNNAILPKSVQQAVNTMDIGKTFSTEDPD